jgi:heme O synthase-like polyprenyltransferase
MNLIIAAIFMILASLFITQPVHAQVPIKDYFSFSNITSLGQATQNLVTPAFSIATTLVVFYFLIGAFRYLKAGGNKEDMEGARQMITHSIIGFFILILAFLALQFIPQYFKLPGLDIIR